MMRLVFLCVFAGVFGIVSRVYSQIEIDSTVEFQFRTIVNLMVKGDAVELSKHIAYPLHRPNPLPDITDPRQFVAQFPILIDSSFRERLKQYSDSDIFENNGLFGLGRGGFNGELWMSEDSDSKLVHLYYSSRAEQTRLADLVRQVKQHMHPSVRDWDDNILVAKTKKLLIRVDRVGHELRYAAWNLGKSQLDKPDLVLTNGKYERKGTMGGETYTFSNNGYSYLVDDSEMGESDEDTGHFLIVYKGDKLLSSSRLELIK